VESFSTTAHGNNHILLIIGGLVSFVIVVFADHTSQLIFVTHTNTLLSQLDNKEESKL
jgi:uncharacterized membrane protein